VDKKTYILKDNISSRKLKDKIFFVIVFILSGITVLPILFIIFELIRRGYRQINISFFFENAPNTLEAMTAKMAGEIIPGGIANGIVGTLLLVTLAFAIAIVPGIMTGIYLAENPTKRYASVIRTLADVLQGVPSIVMGLISYLWIVKSITNGFSTLAGSVALAIMMLPLIIRSTEETLKMIPNTIKEAAFALGVPYYKIIFKVMLPTGMSGLLTGILLSISRVLGETAPLMLTVLGSSVISLNITKPTSAVPLLIWEFYNDPNLSDLIWSSSLFLMGLVLTLNLIAKRIKKKFEV